MVDISRRQALVNRIESTLRSIPMAQMDGSWIKDEKIADFLDAWRELLHYYQESGDPTIDVEVVRHYIDFARLLRETKQDAEISNEFREAAKCCIRQVFQVTRSAFEGAHGRAPLRQTLQRFTGQSTKDVLGGLEYFMDEIIIEVYTNKHS